MYQAREPQVSDREIDRRYAKLKIIDQAPNRVNCYVCSCGYVTKTIDRHVGVTPMMITCDCCKGRATTSFYRDSHPDLEPEYEWFMPTLDEVKKYRRNQAMLDHIFNGGLDYRRIKK
jgi:hypothetical protein